MAQKLSGKFLSVLRVTVIVSIVAEWFQNQALEWDKVILCSVQTLMYTVYYAQVVEERRENQLLPQEALSPMVEKASWT